MKEVCKEFKVEKGRYAVIYIPALVLGVMGSIALSFRLVADEMKIAIDVGVAVGLMICFILLVFLAKSKKAWSFIEKNILGNRSRFIRRIAACCETTSYSILSDMINASGVEINHNICK
ncbi:MAG: hypothetical protein ACI4FZ_12400 [Lachnospiraceae bacterium]